MPSFLNPIVGVAGDRCVLRNTRTGAIVASRLLTAFDSASRNVGLLRHDALPNDTALIIAPTCAIHTFFMTFPIDTAFVAKDGRIVKIYTALRPWRMAGAFRAHAVVEMAAGSLALSGTVAGDSLAVVILDSPIPAMPGHVGCGTAVGGAVTADVAAPALSRGDARAIPLDVLAGRLCAFTVAAFLCARATVDPDLWGHLRFGLDLLQGGRLNAIDRYSFTQDVPLLNHEWLSDPIFALAFQWGGVLGLMLLKSVILATAVLLLASVARRASPRLRWWLLTVSLIGLTPAAITFRPQLWTILGLAMLVRILSGGASLIWLPLIFAVWANLHGGWIVGVGFTGLWITGRLLDTRSLRAIAAPLLALAAGIVATLVNIYGWRLWAFLLSTVSMSRDITEWRPLWEQSDLSHAALWAVMAIVVTGTAALRWSTLTWSSILPVVWLGSSAIFVDRLSPLFCEIALLATAQAWPASVSASTAATAAVPGRLLIDAVVVTLVWAFNAMGAARCLPVPNDVSPDLLAASALAPASVSGRLVLPFNWGEYAIWQFGPRLQVSIDGRREALYSDAAVALQSAVAAGSRAGFDFLDAVRPEYVWLPSGSSAATGVWLAANGYRLDVDTGTSFVARRHDLPPLTLGTPMPSCFP